MVQSVVNETYATKPAEDETCSATVVTDKSAGQSTMGVRIYCVNVNILQKADSVLVEPVYVKFRCRFLT